MILCVLNELASPEVSVEMTPKKVTSVASETDPLPTKEDMPAIATSQVALTCKIKLVELDIDLVHQDLEKIRS